MGDIVFAPRQAARMDREFQRVIEIFVRIALGGIGRQKEQLNFIPMPVQPGCGFLPMVTFKLSKIKSRHFLSWPAGRWPDIPHLATFRYGKNPVSGHA